MALTFLPASLVIESDSSILDLPAFHAQLRDWEDSAEAAVHPVTHTWKAVDLGGAFFYALDLVNGWRLRFPAAGSYVVQGNLGGEILPVAGVYVERKTSAAYATTAVGGSGPSASDIASAVWTHLSRTLTSGGGGGLTAADVWGHETRTLTAQPIPPSASAISAAVWEAMTRTLTSPSGPTGEQIAAAVWNHTQ